MANTNIAPRVEPVKNPWYASDKAYYYYGQMLEKAVARKGFLLKKIESIAIRGALWSAAAVKYIITGGDVDFDAVNAAADRLIGDMVALVDGSYVLKNFDIEVVEGGNLLLFPNGDGSYVSPWFPIGRCFEIHTEMGSDDYYYLIGAVGYRVVPTITQDRITAIYNELDVIVNDKHSHYFGSRSWAYRIKNATCSVYAWRAVIIGTHLKFEIKYSESLEWSFRSPIRWELQAKENGQEVLGDYQIGTLVFDTKEAEFVKTQAPQIQPRHIGDDISYVRSITGGNGADAMEPAATRNVMGQGGNGGHGGGGAGAGGVCKQEVIRKNGTMNIDTSQIAGSMVNGTPGIGTSGTPGRNGGCVIFYLRR